MPFRRSIRYSAIIAILSLLAQTSTPLALGQTPGFQAPGGPICSGLTERADRLEAGLPVQDQWIQKTEEQLRAAEAGLVEPRDALLDIALKSAQQLVLDQLKMVRGAREEIANARGFSRLSDAATERRLAQLNGWVDRIVKSGEEVEKVVKVGKAGVAGADFGRVINVNRATLGEFIKFIETSGISDELGLKAAQLTGPVGVLIVESFMVGRDLLYAGLQGAMTVRDVEAARDNLASLRASRDNVASKAFELRYESEKCLRDQPAPPATQDRMLVTPPPAGGAPASTPASPPAAPPEQKKSGGPDPSVVLGVAALAGGAAYYGYQKYGKTCTKPAQPAYACDTAPSSSQCASQKSEWKTYCDCAGIVTPPGAVCVG